MGLLISFQILKNLVPKNEVVLIEFDVDRTAMRSVAARLYEATQPNGEAVYDITLG